jgi:hypothetical protein
MVRYVGLWLGLLTASGGFAGCTCNKASEYNFPEPPPDDGVGEGEVPASFGSWLSMDTSPEGSRLTISYYDKAAKAVGWAVGVPGEDGSVTWTHERVAGYPADNGLDVADVGMYSTQKTAPDGTVWLAYHNLTTGGLDIAHRLGPNQWELSESIDGGSSKPGVGHWASLVLDAEGKPIVAHVDQASAAVRITRFDGQGWSSQQVYRSLPVDVTDDQGVTTTIPAGVAQLELVSTPDGEYLALYDSAQGALHVLSGDAFGEDELVDDAGNVGGWPSLHIVDGSGGEDGVWVAYHDVGNERLKFASYTQAGGWQTEVVDNGQMRGADTAIFERDGQPAIVYQDAFHNDLWLATREESGEWKLEKQGGDEGPIGFHNEVTFAGGKWWSGSFDYAKNQLFVKAL